MSGLVRFQEVSKHYKTGDFTIKAVDNASFEIDQGEFCVIVGPSGAGKTTVLNMLGGMDSCEQGDIYVDSLKISGLSDRQMTDYRRYDVGFVFQFYNLVQNLTALENVELASEICPKHLKAEEVLAQVGLGGRLHNFPSQLSGGEQQRVAIARAIAKNPKILLCDEPTGALDYQTGKSVLSLLHDCCRSFGKTVVFVTHNLSIPAMADKVIHFGNGTVSKVILNDTPSPIERIEW